MYNIITSAHGMSVEIRPDGRQTRECFVDDDLEVSASGPPITAITLIDAPPGMPPTIEGGTIQCHEVGRFLFRVELGGKSMHLHVLCMERACLARIPSLNHGRIINTSSDSPPPERTLAEQMLILRSLATHAPLFDGTAASFDRLGNLAQYGA